jgi:2-dehydro-3-deoxyphosphooctonate aldolase (KDO 8-P synthase)
MMGTRAMKTLSIGKTEIDLDKSPILIAGPCVLEDGDTAIELAKACAEAAAKAGFFYIFKASYLKDNRSSIDSYTGPGIDRGLEMLGTIGDKAGVPLLTDVHGAGEVSRAAEVCDCLQIPAFLCRQTSLITAAAGTGTVLNLKKGQFLSPEEMGLAVEKAERGGAAGVMVTERGTFFGYNNLIVDFTSFARMESFGVPLIFDATHSLQLPGGLGNRSGGRPGFARILARSAIAAGCDGLFVETHFEPLSCGCDAEAMMPFGEMPGLLEEAAGIFRLVKSFG